MKYKLTNLRRPTKCHHRLLKPNFRRLTPTQTGVAAMIPTVPMSVMMRKKRTTKATWILRNRTTLGEELVRCVIAHLIVIQLVVILIMMALPKKRNKVNPSKQTSSTWATAMQIRAVQTMPVAEVASTSTLEHQHHKYRNQFSRTLAPLTSSKLIAIRQIRWDNNKQPICLAVRCRPYHNLPLSTLACFLTLVMPRKHPSLPIPSSSRFLILPVHHRVSLTSILALNHRIPWEILCQQLQAQRFPIMEVRST